MPKDHAFVVFTHKLTSRVRSVIARAERELAASHDVYVVGLFPDLASAPAEFRERDTYRAYAFADMPALGYPLKGRAEAFLPYARAGADVDLAMMKFFREEAPYETVWSMEWDVDFTGDFGTLVRHLAASDADLLTTNVRPAPLDWPHFQRAVTPQGWPAQDRERHPIAFLPVYRSSRAHLAAVDEFYRDGGQGHFEWVWPYVALSRGLCIADIADLPFEGRRLYTSTNAPGYWPGSFRFRPTMENPGRRRMTLYHPVKETPVAATEYLRTVLRVKYLKAILRSAGTTR